MSNKASGGGEPESPGRLYSANTAVFQRTAALPGGRRPGPQYVAHAAEETPLLPPGESVEMKEPGRRAAAQPQKSGAEEAVRSAVERSLQRTELRAEQRNLVFAGFCVVLVVLLFLQTRRPQHATAGGSGGGAATAAPRPPTRACPRDWCQKAPWVESLGKPSKGGGP